MLGIKPEFNMFNIYYIDKVHIINSLFKIYLVIINKPAKQPLKYFFVYINPFI